MTRTRHIALGVAAAIIALGLGAAVFASPQNTNPGPGPFMGRMGPGMGPMGMGPFGRMRMLADKLGLSDAQKQQIRTILQSHRDEWKGLADRARQAHQKLNAAVTADQIDDTAIRQAATDLGSVEADMAVSRAHVRAEVFQVLTPDQQAQAKQLQADMQQKMQQRMQRRQK